MTSNTGNETPYSHLSPHTRSFLEKSKTERIEETMREKWIGYPRAKDALTQLHDLINAPKTHRPDYFMIVGESNNGKTMIIERFLRDFPADDNPSGEAASVPVMFVQTPYRPDPRALYGDILDQMFATYRQSTPIGKLQTQAISLMEGCGVRMIILDEIHNAGDDSPTKVSQFLNLIRYLGNRMKVPVVCLGVPKGLSMLQSDTQLANRVIPFHLPEWEDDIEYRRLLNSYESLIPLKKPSGLAQDQVAAHIREKAGNTIGEAHKLIRKAAVYSIKNDKDKIDLQSIRNCNYVRIKDRTFRNLKSKKRGKE